MDPLGTNVGKTTVTRDAHCDTSKKRPQTLTSVSPLLVVHDLGHLLLTLHRTF